MNDLAIFVAVAAIGSFILFAVLWVVDWCEKHWPRPTPTPRRDYEYETERVAKYAAWKYRLSSQDPRLCSEVDHEPFDAPPEAAELRRAEQERRDRINGLIDDWDGISGVGTDGLPF